MSLVERIESLRSKHRSLDTELHDEMSRPLPDATAVAQLKHRKLEIKDEIQRLSQENR